MESSELFDILRHIFTLFGRHLELLQEQVGPVHSELEPNHLIWVRPSSELYQPDSGDL